MNHNIRSKVEKIRKKYLFNLLAFLTLFIFITNVNAELGLSDDTKPNLEFASPSCLCRNNVTNNYNNISVYNVTGGGGNVSGGGQTGQLAYFVNGQNISGTNYFSYSTDNNEILVNSSSDIASYTAYSNFNGNMIRIGGDVNTGLFGIKLGQGDYFSGLNYYYNINTEGNNNYLNLTIGQVNSQLGRVKFTNNITGQCFTFRDGTTQCSASSGSGSGGNVSGGGSAGQLAYFVNGQNISGISESYFDGTYLKLPFIRNITFDYDGFGYVFLGMDVSENMILDTRPANNLFNILSNIVNISGNITGQCFTFRDGTTQCSASSGSGMNYTNIVMTNKTTQQNINDLNVSAIDVGSGSVQISNGGFLEIYSTFPSFFLNESDCPFGNCKNAYFMLDGNRFQLQSYSAGRVYEYGVMDLNMRAPNQLSSDYLGRIGLGGMGSGDVLGTVNINSSRTYSPQLNFKNSTLATTRYAGSLERSANKLIYTQNDLNHTQVMMLRNISRYSCDSGNRGEFGYNYSDNRAYFCNSTNWRILA